VIPAIRYTYTTILYNPIRRIHNYVDTGLVILAIFLQYLEYLQRGAIIDLKRIMRII